MDQNPDPVLDDLAQRAYDFSINLDGRVERSPTLYSRGHCAVVYKGTFLPNNIEVAVKIAAGDLARRGILEVIKDAVREVHTWSKVRHKNVHPLLGITTEFDHTISFVSAWMEKGNAHDYVQDVEVDPRPLIQGIARGLHYLHDYKPASIFHGNLKGSNVLVSQDGHALLTDFGFTRVVNSSLKMTVDKICAGALNWMAPEIVKGGELSAEGDVWAFGMTALELFTRSIPFPDRGHPLVRPSEDETLSRLTDRWWEMCSSCWDGQPFLRPQMSGVMKSISLLSTEELRPDAVRDDRVLEISGLARSSFLSSP
ncbi:kinase-like domain-containing protein [Scleroderma citrinum]